MTDLRIVFDFEIEFANGGGLSGEGFRLDLPAGMGADGTVDERCVADAIVADLRLLMVSAVRILRVRVIEEPHRRAGATSGLPVGTIIELNHVIRDGQVTYPGLPGPVVGAHLSRNASRERYAPGTEFLIGSISMVGNTGTYLDTPFHRYADGFDLAGLKPEACVGVPGVVVRAVGIRAIEPDLLADVDTWGRAVLFETGRDVDFATPAYGVDAPFLTAATAERLIAGGARLAGIDAVNIDDTRGGDRPVHSALLAAGIPVVEHLAGLDRLPATGFEFTALPPRIAEFGTFPVRAIARITA